MKTLESMQKWSLNIIKMDFKYKKISNTKTLNEKVA